MLARLTQPLRSAAEAAAGPKRPPDSLQISIDHYVNTKARDRAKERDQVNKKFERDIY